MSPLAEIVSGHDLLQVVWVSLAAGIGVTVAYGFAILGGTRALDLSRAGRGGGGGVFGGLCAGGAPPGGAPPKRGGGPPPPPVRGGPAHPGGAPRGARGQREVGGPRRPA